MYIQRLRKLTRWPEAFYNRNLFKWKKVTHIYSESSRDRNTVLLSPGHAYMGLLMSQILPDIHFSFGSYNVPLGLAHLPSSYPCGIDREGVGT